MGLIRRLRKRWREFRQERRLKKARRTPTKAVIYVAPYEHPMRELVSELALHGIKIEKSNTPFIKQKPMTIEVKKMPAKNVVDFAKSRNVTFKLKGKRKA